MFCVSDDINVDPADTMQRMTFIDELHALHQNELLRMSTSRHRVPKRPAKHVKYQNPPLWLMIKLTWQAPVTKFWTFQLFYAMFCVLLGVATMMPNCRNYGLNFAVLGWTSAYLLECIFRYLFVYRLILWPVVHGGSRQLHDQRRLTQTYLGKRRPSQPRLPQILFQL